MMSFSRGGVARVRAAQNIRPRGIRGFNFQCDLLCNKMGFRPLHSNMPSHRAPTVPL